MPRRAPLESHSRHAARYHSRLSRIPAPSHGRAIQKIFQNPRSRAKKGGERMNSNKGYDDAPAVPKRLSFRVEYNRDANLYCVIAEDQHGNRKTLTCFKDKASADAELLKFEANKTYQDHNESKRRSSMELKFYENDQAFKADCAKYYSTAGQDKESGDRLLREMDASGLTMQDISRIAEEEVRRVSRTPMDEAY